MKAFQFTLEAVRTLRQSKENEALEQYARCLLLRQRALDAVEAARERIRSHWGEMRRALGSHCPAVEARQLQEHGRALEQRQMECVTALRAAERGVSAAWNAMNVARQQREIVDTYRDKQRQRHERLAAREEQKALDEFAARRASGLPLAPATAL